MSDIEQLERIIEDCKAGQADAFSQLVDLYANRCYGYFCRLSGSRDVSDDLLSELFVKLVKKIATFKGSAFDGWLFRVASNVFYDYLRDKQRQKKLLDGQKAGFCEQEYERKNEDARGEQLQNQLMKLDADSRELIMLRFYSELSFKEISAIRSEPIGTTLSKLHRGLGKLRGLML